MALKDKHLGAALAAGVGCALFFLLPVYSVNEGALQCLLGRCASPSAFADAAALLPITVLFLAGGIATLYGFAVDVYTVFDDGGVRRPGLRGGRFVPWSDVLGVRDNTLNIQLKTSRRVETVNMVFVRDAAAVKRFVDEQLRRRRAERGGAPGGVAEGNPGDLV